MPTIWFVAKCIAYILIALLLTTLALPIGLDRFQACLVLLGLVYLLRSEPQKQ